MIVEVSTGNWNQSISLYQQNFPIGINWSDDRYSVRQMLLRMIRICDQIPENPDWVIPNQNVN